MSADETLIERAALIIKVEPDADQAAERIVAMVEADVRHYLAGKVLAANVETIAAKAAKSLGINPDATDMRLLRFTTGYLAGYVEQGGEAS